MSNEHNAGEIYQIKVKGHLPPQWKDWFCGMTITQEDNGETLLSGVVVDQSALHSLLKKVRDLGLPLLSVNQVSTQTNSSDLETQTD